MAIGIVTRVNDAVGGVEVGTHWNSRGVLGLDQYRAIASMVQQEWARSHQENCIFAFSAFPSRISRKKQKKAEKAGKLRHSKAGSTAIKHEKHEKQCAVFLMRRTFRRSRN